MKALFSFLSCLIMLALFTRCADDELDGPSDGLPDKGLVVRLSTGGGLETKTPLNSTGAYHHVKEVWAVLYKWNEKTSTTDPTNNENYEFITAEKLDWNPSKPAPDRSEFTSEEAYRAAYEQYVLETGGAYGNGNLQQKDFELEVDVDGVTLPRNTYRILCIGLDDKSGYKDNIYGLKDASDNKKLNENIFATGKTLADAVATITNIENAFEGELFAGWAEFQFEPDNLNIVEVEMKRRVAGVLCYVTDIPRVITDNTGDQLVKGIRLVLNTQANNQVHLCRLEGEERPQDFGSSTGNDNPFANTTVLATYDLSEYVKETDDPTQMDKGDIFTWVEQTTTSGAKIKANSLLMGAYLLPVEAPESGATLSVQLLGGSSYKADDLTNPNVDETRILATFNATRSGVEEGGDPYRYDILPNYIYHIGNKPEPDGTDKDEPVSLLGQKITVTPMEWDKSYKIPVEYPSVSIESTLQLVEVSLGDGETEVSYDENGVPIGTIKYLTEGYEFDCIGIDDDNNEAYRDEYYMGAPYNKRLFLKVTKNVLGTGWDLNITGNENCGNMLYISELNPDTKEYEYLDLLEDGDGSKDVYIPLLLTSYAENDETKTDRSVKITLTRSNNTTDELTVTQKNALISDDLKSLTGIISYGKRGYSHVDWNDGETVEWGYEDSQPRWIYGFTATEKTWNKGGEILEGAQGEAYKEGNSTQKSYFKESAIYKCARKFVTITQGAQGSQDRKKDTSKDWYLPARRELYGFLNKYPAYAGYEEGVISSTQYWSSTAYLANDTYWNFINDEGEIFDEVERDSPSYIHNRKTKHAMRATCIISE